jgi:hypothetical protein
MIPVNNNPVVHTDPATQILENGNTPAVQTDSSLHPAVVVSTGTKTSVLNSGFGWLAGGILALVFLGSMGGNNGKRKK